MQDLESKTQERSGANGFKTDMLQIHVSVTGESEDKMATTVCQSHNFLSVRGNTHDICHLNPFLHMCNVMTSCPVF